MKILLGLITTLLLILFSITTAYAADLSVRLDEPKSPTNSDTFDIGLVSLDIPGRNVTAQCYKKGPSDAGYSPFGGSIVLGGGGGTSACSVTSSIVSEQGTYQFYATAAAGTDTESSQTVAVDYNTSGPGTPVSYSKEKSGSCEYKIKFKTADDGGKTSYVEIYRSETITIGLDAGSRVGTVSAGSNEEKTFTNTVSDCGKDYYYVIRAFDTSGNGSGTIGDTVVTTATTTSTTTTSTTTSGEEGVADTGAIAIAEEDSFVGEIEDEETKEDEDIKGDEDSKAEEETEAKDQEEAEGAVLGAETVLQDINWTLVVGGVGLLALALFGYFYYSRRKTSAE